jgi:hypothetical protein
VSANKPARRIVGDVERRLLPGFRITLAAAQQEKKHSDAVDAAKAEMVDVLIHALDYRPNQHDDDKICLYTRNSGKLDARVTSSDVQFSIRIPHEHARAFAELFARCALGPAGNPVGDVVD